MAQLQGHFLKHKTDALDAIRNVNELVSVSKSGSPPAPVMQRSNDVDEAFVRERALRRAKRGPISAIEVDKMPFNPQPGWDTK
jgi:hypothetical protein